MPITGKKNEVMSSYSFPIQFVKQLSSGFKKQKAPLVKQGGANLFFKYNVFLTNAVIANIPALVLNCQTPLLRLSSSLFQQPFAQVEDASL